MRLSHLPSTSQPSSKSTRINKSTVDEKDPLRSVNQSTETENIISITVNTDLQKMNKQEEIVIKSVDELIKLIGSSFVMNGQKYSL